MYIARHIYVFFRVQIDPNLVRNGGSKYQIEHFEISNAFEASQLQKCIAGVGDKIKQCKYILVRQVL